MVAARQVPFIDLAAQYRSLQPRMDEAVREVLEGGWYILGERGERLEGAIAGSCGALHGIGVNSGTDALQLALLACGVACGDVVITVPNTAVPTVCAIAATGAEVAFVDIEPETFTLDPRCLADYLERAERPERVKAVVPVHLYGQAAAMEPILQLAGTHGLRVVEDVAQAQGAAYRGQPVGSFGDTGCLSFYPTKTLGAYGDGGMVVTSDGQIAETLRRLRNYGEAEKNRNVMLGFNSRLDELQAAILSVKLDHLESWNNRRRELALLYDRLLADSSVETPREADGNRHVYHLYVVRSSRRDDLRRHLSHAGIQTAVHYPTPIHHQEAYKSLGYPRDAFPESVRATREVLSLPLYPELSEDAVHYVCETLRNFR